MTTTFLAPLNTAQRAAATCGSGDRQRRWQVGLRNAFSVMDRGDCADLMDIARQELGLATKDRRFPRKDTCAAIYSQCVNT